MRVHQVRASVALMLCQGNLSHGVHHYRRDWRRPRGICIATRMPLTQASFPGDAYFALGQFYRLCPDWTIVQMLVGTKGDIDESIRWHRKGVAFTPTRAEMSKELGVSLLCKASRDDDPAALAEGKKWLNKALAMPSQKATDDIDKKQIPIILSRADDACGYSRDGWQEVSKEAYEKSKN